MTALSDIASLLEAAALGNSGSGAAISLGGLTITAGAVRASVGPFNSFLGSLTQAVADPSLSDAADVIESGLAIAAAIDPEPLTKALVTIAPLAIWAVQNNLAAKRGALTAPWTADAPTGDNKDR